MLFCLLFFIEAFAGIDLWSSGLSVMVATHFATLHRPTTTPTRNNLSKQTPKSAQDLHVSYREIAKNFLGVVGGAIFSSRSYFDEQNGILSRENI